MAQYDNSVALALRLITKFGETANIYRRSDTIPDAAKPWARTTTETAYETPAVWLEAELSRPPGSVVQAGDQIVYVPASGLSITPDASIDQIERASGERWSIVAVRTLSPGGQVVMHELVVRQ